MTRVGIVAPAGSRGSLEPRDFATALLVCIACLVLFLCSPASAQHPRATVTDFEKQLATTADALRNPPRNVGLPPFPPLQGPLPLENGQVPSHYDDNVRDFEKAWEALFKSTNVPGALAPNPPSDVRAVRDACLKFIASPPGGPRSSEYVALCQRIVTAGSNYRWRFTPAPAMTLTSSASPAPATTPATFVAAVAGITPSGEVEFTADGNPIPNCSHVALVGTGNTATASCTTSGLTLGPHLIQARYFGDGRNNVAVATLNQYIGAPGVIQFVSASYEVLESAGSVQVWVQRSRGETGDVTVQYETVDGSAASVETATTRQDFVAKADTLKWQNNSPPDPIPITIQLVVDRAEEMNKTFRLRLMNPTGGASLGAIRETTVLIIDDSKPIKKVECRYLDLTPRTATLRGGESVTFQAIAVMSNSAQVPIEPQTWEPGPTATYVAPADPHFNQRVRVTATWRDENGDTCRGSTEVTLLAGDWSPPLSSGSQLGARGEEPGPADYTWYAVCKKASGEVVYRENPDIITDYVMAGPFPGPRNAEFWIRQSCPRWRCTTAGACAAEPALAETGRPGYFALCSKATGDIVIGRAEDVTRYFAMSPPLLGEPEAREWVTRNCPTWRCSANGACARAPQVAATGAEAWFVVCDPSSGAITFGKQVPFGSRAMAGPLRGEPDARAWLAANCPAGRCSTDGICARTPVPAPTGREGWYVFCDLNNGSLLYGKQALGNERALAGPFVGEPDARSWTQANCPSQRCTRDGLCAPGAASVPADDALRLFGERETARTAGRGSSLSIGSPTGAGFTSQTLQEAMRSQMPAARSDASGLGTATDSAVSVAAGSGTPGTSAGTTSTPGTSPTTPAGGTRVPATPGTGPTQPATSTTAPLTPTPPTTTEQKRWYGIETKVVYDWQGRTCTLTDRFEGEATPSGLAALTNEAQGKALAPVRGAGDRTVQRVTSSVYAGPAATRPAYTGKTGVQCTDSAASASAPGASSGTAAQDYLLEAVVAYEKTEYGTGGGPRTITCTLTGWMVYLIKASELQASLREWGQGTLGVVRGTAGALNGRLLSTRVVSGPSTHIPYPNPQHKIACAQ